MGGDPVAAVGVLGRHVYHVHGKDTRIEPRARIDGLLDAKHVVPVRGRSWNFVSLGHGTPVRGWLDILRALRDAGYDDVVSIENQDYSLAPEDAVSVSAATLGFAIAGLARDGHGTG